VARWHRRRIANDACVDLDMVRYSARRTACVRERLEVWSMTVDVRVRYDGA
jgi:hypothetical protein